MLVEFRLGNYRSFHEPQTLSLVAGRDRSHPDNLISCGKDNLLKAAAIYGANASGKSNLIKALHFVYSLVCTSATRMNVGDEIDAVPFRLDPDSGHQPSLFEVTLILEKIRYQYGFTVTPQHVHDEWLIAYPRGRPQRWYERRYNPDTRQTQWTFRGDLKKAGDVLRERTRDNGLALSRGAELNVAQLVPFFRWFRDDLRVFDLSGAPIRFLIQRTAERFLEDSRFSSTVRRLVQDADLGIKDIRVTQELRPDYVQRVLSAASGVEPEHGIAETEVTPVRTLHSKSGTDQEEVFDFEEAESKGTQRLFGLTRPWLDALENGGVVVVDELDCSMHPVLTRSLIELFQSPEVNREGAQLIFATHDSTLMDQSLFRRDQIWLVEKDANQASRLFSLYDFDDKPRKGEALEKRYLAGRYGGVPMLGATFEDLEL